MIILFFKGFSFLCLSLLIILVIIIKLLYLLTDNDVIRNWRKTSLFHKTKRIILTHLYKRYKTWRYKTHNTLFKVIGSFDSQETAMDHFPIKGANQTCLIICCHGIPSLNFTAFFHFQ